jgi:hypothetical protein
MKVEREGNKIEKRKGKKNNIIGLASLYIINK